MVIPKNPFSPCNPMCPLAHAGSLALLCQKVDGAITKIYSLELSKGVKYSKGTMLLCNMLGVRFPNTTKRSHSSFAWIFWGLYGHLNSDSSQPIPFFSALSPLISCSTLSHISPLTRLRHHGRLQPVIISPLFCNPSHRRIIPLTFVTSPPTFRF